MQYSKEVITKLQEKGWEITKSSSWIRCEYPREQITLEKGETEKDIEINLVNTFLINLKQAGFEITLEEIEE